MNKFLIVILAICLVSVHAFVKREAETPKDGNIFDSAYQSFQQSAQEANAQITKVLNPENIKKGFSDLIENLNKALNDLKTDTAKPQ